MEKQNPIVKYYDLYVLFIFFGVDTLVRVGKRYEWIGQMKGYVFTKNTNDLNLKSNKLCWLA